ncbi:hypothetical protein EVAR_24285_1 [Eumeta japonica]|uniref:Uncharacterized protein n=1 Tax=Eumeta variegata TaxID=151549 RepID=A0A4C1VEW6_EUMVA|nr:hypothetical protein EVAR_24285_1 [Eumeta japonica]
MGLKPLHKDSGRCRGGGVERGRGVGASASTRGQAFEMKSASQLCLCLSSAAGITWRSDSEFIFVITYKCSFVVSKRWLSLRPPTVVETLPRLSLAALDLHRASVEGLRKPMFSELSDLGTDQFKYTTDNANGGGHAVWWWSCVGSVLTSAAFISKGTSSMLTAG